MQTQFETPNETYRYVPVPNRPVIAEPHIEDYLDHVCAPLIGVMSYEDRQRVRDKERETLEAIITAHVEMGSTRQEAIAATLLARPILTQAVVKPVSVLPVQQTVSVTVNAREQWTRRSAFALAASNALIGIPAIVRFAHLHPPYRYTWTLGMAAMTILPAITSSLFGAVFPAATSRMWRRASLLTMPLVSLSYLASIWHWWHILFRIDILVVLLLSSAHAVVSASIGSIGIQFGRAFRKQSESSGGESTKTVETRASRI